MKGSGAGLFVELRACPACGSGALRPYKKGTFSDRLTQEQIKITDSAYGKTWDLSVCDRCGHIFANPCPTPEFILSLYGQVEDPQYEEEAEGRSRNFLRILNHLEKIAPAKGSLLDVGAATGILLDLARRRGWKAHGVEPSSWAVNIAAQKYGLHLIEGAFETISLPKGHYAAITMVDFLEHTPLPFEAVKKAHQVLRPDGILVLVTPDILSPAARLAGRRWWHLRPAHLAFFSRASLTALLRRAGFLIAAERRYAWTFSASYLLSRRPAFRPLLKIPALASFLRRIPVKLALGDSFEIYAVKDKGM
ncbi:MAG: methyltransferase domain-containing protein [Acidobacteriota bacterium]